VADKHPYSPGPGGVTAAISHLQKSFPKTVTADTLKKLGIAPKNESYVINILRFIGAIDKDGNRTDKAAAVFSKSGQEFEKDFEGLLREAYADLFDIHQGDSAWTLAADKLKAFFRSSDQSSDLVGGLQAQTFKLLASFAGHGTIPAPAAPKPAASKPKAPKEARPAKGQPADAGNGTASEPEARDVGLTVRIEINLPPDGDQGTYDRIFRSIRENLLNGK
jgi:Family of unknown function (DUF5343)